jgi:hypothetical protein
MSKLELAVTLALIGALEADDASMEAGSKLRDAVVAAWGLPTKSKSCAATAAMKAYRATLGAEKVNATMADNEGKKYATLDKVGQAARKYTRLNTTWTHLKNGRGGK